MSSPSNQDPIRHQPTFSWSWLAPRFWPLWLWFGLLWTLTRLPIPWVYTLGRRLGGLFYLLLKKRRKIVHTNLRLCFPDLDENAIQQLARENFAQWGITILESGWAWWNDPDDLARRCRFENTAPCQQLLAQNTPVLIMVIHTACLEIAYAQLSQRIPYSCLFRVNSNPLWEFMAFKGRKRYPVEMLPRKQVKNLIMSLKSGKAGLLAPDHDMGAKHSLFAPFFGVQAATVVTIPDLARQTGAKVVFAQAYREGFDYVIKLSDPLDNYPSGDLLADVTTQNKIFEQAIAEHPEQYMWVHRRFKTRPEGEPKIY